jgi:methyl-accepting chemotaxis protein
MMKSFRESMPIRGKLLTVFASMVALICVPTLVALLRGDFVTAGVGAAVALVAALLGRWYREAIAHPYVGTVVRMEALARGDLDSPIEFTHYTDCVGRMTKAMFVFRDTANKQRVAQAEEQAAVVDLFGDALKALRSGDLTVRITAEAPEAYQALKTSYNEAVAAIAGLIRTVAESTAEIRTGSGEIAQASEDLARRTESNAASLEETSAAISQMDARLKASAGAATATVGRADQAITTVSGGREVADEAVQR